jgi:hypothetical protein
MLNNPVRQSVVLYHDWDLNDWAQPPCVQASEGYGLHISSPQNSLALALISSLTQRNATMVGGSESSQAFSISQAITQPVASVKRFAGHSQGSRGTVRSQLFQSAKFPTAELFLDYRPKFTCNNSKCVLSEVPSNFQCL